MTNPPGTGAQRVTDATDNDPSCCGQPLDDAGRCQHRPRHQQEFDDTRLADDTIQCVRLLALSGGSDPYLDGVAAICEELQAARGRAQAIRELHRDEYGICRECSHESGVTWPCPTIAILDGADG